MTRELVRPDKLDQSVSLHGMDYIDVPALGKRDYKLNFYSFKECTIVAKVEQPHHNPFLFSECTPPIPSR